ncbi:DNA cytosine methyltransferase [Mariprofundus ferrooxydans]|uniref:DNA cytosine methyltransferase n=1 Tax=Mariprofundus ferrooxydans TaxID=314344 RepID=UPI00036C3717|nr:DNA cytosine methyltransferase [Mariprofundus ferrooxydans]
MSGFIEKAEDALRDVAKDYSPPGSTVEAVIDQWLHAIASGSDLFAANRGIDEKSVIRELKRAGLYESKATFSRNLYDNIHLKPPVKHAFRFIDLFAGIGGIRLGFQMNGGTCVFSSEYDKNAQATYKNNYGETPFGDITEIDPVEIPDHDILLAGFPCQPFSHAGVSARNSRGSKHGFECKTQGTLFFDIMRIALEKRPKVLFLENVRNIERHDKGNTFETIKESIKEIGYDFKHAIINSSTLVPQKRVRCYMVCFRSDLKKEFEFPDFEGLPLPLSSVLEEQVDDKFTISDRLWLGHINRTKRNIARGTGFTAHTADLSKPSNTIVARYGKDGKECLIPQEGKNPRLLTPRECARLQGFPENFLFPSAKTPAYKQFGNSVAVPVIEKIAATIIEGGL